MSEGVVGAQQAFLVGNGRDVLFEHLFAVDDRSYLQQVELARAVGVDIACKLNLHGAFHVSRAEFLCHLQQFGQWENTLLQHSAEGDDLSSALIDAVSDDLVVWVVG